MEYEKVSKEEIVRTRVARYKDLKAFPESFVDTVIPRYERDLFSIIGKSVFEDPAMQPAIQERHPFSFSMIRVDPAASIAAPTRSDVRLLLAERVSWG